jgi:hypothetical protein
MNGRACLLVSSIILLSAPVALAHDHQWIYDRCEWQADLARGRALVQLSDCDAALLAEVRAQFAQMDAQVLPIYLRLYRPAGSAPPAPAGAPPTTPAVPSVR